MYSVVTARQVVLDTLQRKADALHDHAWEQWHRKDMYYLQTDGNEHAVACVCARGSFVQLDLFYAESSEAVQRAVGAALVHLKHVVHTSHYLEEDNCLSVLDHYPSNTGFLTFTPVRLGLLAGYPNGPVQPSDQTAWGKAGVRIVVSSDRYTHMGQAGSHDFTLSNSWP